MVTFTRADGKKTAPKDKNRCQQCDGGSDIGLATYLHFHNVKDELRLFIDRQKRVERDEVGIPNLRYREQNLRGNFIEHNAALQNLRNHHTPG